MKFCPLKLRLFSYLYAGCLSILFVNPADAFAQDSSRGAYRGDFKAAYRTSSNEFKNKNLSDLRRSIDKSCVAKEPSGCSKLCYWQIMDKQNSLAEKNCQFACQKGEGSACVASNLIKQINNNRTNNPALIIATYLLDLTCKGDKITNCNPLQMKSELNNLLNKNSYDLAWSVALGCKRGYDESCQLANYLVKADPLPSGGQDLVQALIDYSCHEHASETCAVASLFNGMNQINNIASQLFNREKE